MSLTEFWAGIDRQIERLRTAGTAAEVVEILPSVPGLSTGDGFFEGGGGDVRPDTPLREAGWTFAWYRAPYYWAMTAPDGSSITYIEGDIYLGNTRRTP